MPLTDGGTSSNANGGAAGPRAARAGLAKGIPLQEAAAKSCRSRRRESVPRVKLRLSDIPKHSFGFPVSHYPAQACRSSPTRLILRRAQKTLAVRAESDRLLRESVSRFRSVLRLKAKSAARPQSLHLHKLVFKAKAHSILCQYNGHAAPSVSVMIS